jgi:hypothetical protein
LEEKDYDKEERERFGGREMKKRYALWPFGLGRPGGVMSGIRTNKWSLPAEDCRIRCERPTSRGKPVPIPDMNPSDHPSLPRLGLGIVSCAKIETKDETKYVPILLTRQSEVEPRKNGWEFRACEA